MNQVFLFFRGIRGKLIYRLRLRVQIFLQGVNSTAIGLVVAACVLLWGSAVDTYADAIVAVVAGCMQVMLPSVTCGTPSFSSCNLSQVPFFCTFFCYTCSTPHPPPIMAIPNLRTPMCDVLGWTGFPFILNLVCNKQIDFNVSPHALTSHSASLGEASHECVA